jgi:hypothetical protein
VIKRDEAVRVISNAFNTVEKQIPRRRGMTDVVDGPDAVVVADREELLRQLFNL